MRPWAGDEQQMFAAGAFTALSGYVRYQAKCERRIQLFVLRRESS